ncbi:MAG TPA: IPT/TIG domain-containing protein, partial [Elusimicrobiales bacterium]|nr:IPT/TIG domain-containing protein [Elusimicrobiales bacterium]
MAPANAWISRHFNKTSGAYVYRLNILDYGAPSFAEYRAELALDSVDLPPAAVGDLSASTAGGGALSLAWTAPGEDGTSGAMMGARYLIQAEHDAGAVFGPEHAQVNITTNTSPGEAQAYVVRGLPGNGDHYLRLWTQDTGGNVSDISNSTQAWTAPNPPAGGMAEALSSSSVRAHWTMGNNLLPIGYQVYFATAPAAPWISSSPVYELLVTSHVFSGLATNTTCFFFGRAVNTDTLAASSDAALGVAVTLAAAPETPVFTVHYTSFSVAWTGGGNPAGTQYLVEVSTAAEGAPVLASSGWTDGLEFLFENLSVDTTYYVRARARNWAGAETPSVAFGAPRTGLADLLPPVTTPVFTGPVFGTEPLFVSGLTEISFAASDYSVAPGDGQGVVAEVRYSVDAGTFTVYAGTFTLQVDGVHTLSYYAVDADGNAEAVKTSTITVDNIAPAAGLEITGPVFSSASVSYAASASTVALAAYDGGSRVRELYYEVSGSTYSAAASSVTLVLPEGMHTLSYSASDNLGNLSQVRVSSLAVDGMAPAVELLVAGSTVPDGGTAYVLETGSISLTAVDPVSNGVASGLRGIYYLVDIAWAECPEGEPPFTGPSGTCGNPRYEGSFTLTPGTHTVYYLAHDRVGNNSAVKTAYFTVGIASVAATASITPSSGAIGLPFTITGSGFGTYAAGVTNVLIGGAAAPLTLWSTDTIKGTVPGALAAGEYPVVVMHGSQLLAETSSFTVVVPALAAVSPSSGAIGLPFVIDGTGFGNYVANYTRVLIGGATCPLTLWTDTQIKGTIPGTIAPGVHEVLVERELNGGLVRSATAAFDLRNMEADWIAPSSGPIGMPFTIAGSGFGNYVANYTTVLMGGTTCPLTLWTDGQINGTVPGGLATGQYPVLVERRTSDGGVMHSPEMSFTVLAVDAASMTPVAG